ncbi:23S rRNA (adenine(2503)-C(2))-methyltransferase RlmN [Candidatus Peregrinibacteria bacterium]|nr:23S rRNA (adenine(2503)-C(2))-methyltransferase RlmN [Candidatus Peregrinibacteria bacterium]
MIFKQPLLEFLKENFIPLYRADQLLHAVYGEGKNTYESIKTLPQNLRKQLEENFPIFSFTVKKEVVSKSGDVIKTLFKLKDGAEIEGVLMKFKNGRKTVCVSSQVGCGLKCAFCATGAMGFKRNLKAEEIVDQVLYFGRVTNVVFMGMGEPFLNYDEVMKAVRIMNDPDLIGIAARRITISTSGIIPGIKALADENVQVNLAVSLHAPNQTLREKLMPIAKSYKLSELMEAIKEYIKKTHRRVSYEYVMLYGINDSQESAMALAKLIKGQMCHVNLIPYNETYLGFKNAGKDRINKLAEILKSFNIPVTVRVSLGQEISAACGQLRNVITRAR